MECRYSLAHLIKLMRQIIPFVWNFKNTVRTLTLFFLIYNSSWWYYFNSIWPKIHNVILIRILDPDIDIYYVGDFNCRTRKCVGKCIKMCVLQKGSQLGTDMYTWFSQELQYFHLCIYVRHVCCVDIITHYHMHPRDKLLLLNCSNCNPNPNFFPVKFW